MFRYQGWRARTPQQQVELAVRILDGGHFEDVRDRARAELGNRADMLGPLDMTRNTLLGYVRRVNRAHDSPVPLVDGLSEQLATLLGDQSARTTVDLYGMAGGRPMPSTLISAAREAYKYRLGAGYAGLLIGYSERARQVYLEVVKPDSLQIEYHSHDPMEPTIIRHERLRHMDGRTELAVDVYDLSDLGAPSFRTEINGEDKTEELHGRTFEGDDYWWRYSDGTPFHRLVVVGDTRHPYATDPLVQTTLSVCTLYTHWLAGIRDAGHPQRNVRGLTLVGLDTDSATGQAGFQTGPETILQWVDVDPERPGSHWQDSPAADMESVGRAIRDYELTAMAGLGLPIGFEKTGGEPLAYEQQALSALIAKTYPECRRLDSEVLRRVAAMANRADLVDAQLNEDPYGVLFRGEVTEALGMAEGQFEQPEEAEGTDSASPVDTVAVAGEPEAPVGLNGAQVSAFMDVLKSVADGTINDTAALVTLQSAFPGVTAEALTAAIDSQKTAKVPTQ